MKALVFHGPGKRAWEDKPRPAIKDATDAIVRITTSTICGTDLHILKGDLPAVTDGRILGHEGVGVVEEVGKGRVELQGRRRGRHLLRHRVREVRRSAGRGCTRTARTAAGSSATSSTGPRPSTSASRTRTRASTRCRTARTRRRYTMLSDILPDRLRVRGPERPGEAGRHGGDRGRRARSASPRCSRRSSTRPPRSS